MILIFQVFSLNCVNTCANLVQIVISDLQNIGNNICIMIILVDIFTHSLQIMMLKIINQSPAQIKENDEETVERSDTVIVLVLFDTI